MAFRIPPLDLDGSARRRAQDADLAAEGLIMTCVAAYDRMGRDPASLTDALGHLNAIMVATGQYLHYRDGGT